MEKLNRKKLILISLLAFISIACFIVHTNLNASNAQSLKLSFDGNLNDSYEHLYNFVAPAGQIEKDGVKYAADSCILVYPSLQEKNGYENNTLSEYGRYKLKYFVKINEVDYEAEKYFSVFENTFKTNSLYSTVEYKESIEMQTTRAEAGLHLKLYNNEHFEFNKPIDIAALSNFGEFITFYPYVDYCFDKLSETAGTSSKLHKPVCIKIKLTDETDSKNFVVVEYSVKASGIQQDKPGYAVYFTAYANNQTTMGWAVNKDSNTETSVNKVIKYNGIDYFVRTNSGYGTSTKPYYSLKDVGVTVGFNQETTEVRIQSENESLVNVLNNPDIYGEQLFNGFKGSKVNLSIWVEQFTPGYDYCELDITRIGEDVGSMLESYVIKDSTAPVLSVSYNDTVELNIAKNAKFYPFEYTVSDNSDILETKISLYTLNGNERVYVDKLDEYFIPRTEGKHYLEYSATDVFGNNRVKTIELTCKENNGQGIKFSTQRLSSAVFGENTFLPRYNVEGLNFTPFISVKVSSPSGEIIFGEDGSFVPNSMGEYKVRYDYHDDVYSGSYEYSLDILSSDMKLLYQQPKYASYYIKGMKHALESVYIITCENDAEILKSAKTYVLEDGKTDLSSATVVNNGVDYICKASENVKFLTVYDNVVLYESAEIPVVDVYTNEKFDISKYFVSNEADVAAHISGVSLNFDGTSNSASVDFIGEILLSSFGVRFNIPKDKASFSNLKFRISDFYNPNDYFDITYTIERASYFAQINNNTANSFTKPITDRSYIDISYSNGELLIVDYYNVKYKYNPDFKSSKINLSILVDGIYGDSEVNLHQIMGVNVNSNTLLGSNKPILEAKTISGNYAVGDVLRVPYRSVSDVLTPAINASVKLTLTNTAGQYMVIDGEEIYNYEMKNDLYFTFTSIGNYKITYTSISQTGVTSVSAITIRCVDTVPPKITLENNYNKDTLLEAAIDSTITIAEYTSDDSLATVIVFVKNSKGVYVRLTENTFNATEAGIYTVYYFAQDAEKNSTLTSYKIKVV